MDTEKEMDSSPYIEALRKAKTDNERFAALLMVAKVTKDGSGNNVKREILEAVGKKFFSRLLKTKTIPDDCPPNVYKSVAMSILSALCSEPDLALHPVLTDNVTCFNGIVLQDPSKESVSDVQLVDDTYQCFSCLCQTSEGVEALVQGKSVSTLCEAIISQSYGFEKAQDVLFCIVSSVGVHTWAGCEMVFNSIFLHFSKQFKEEQGEKKFELCKTLVFLLTSVPREVENLDKPSWLENVITGLDSILRSKIGTSQREPALRLASMLVQVSGIEAMLPPVTADCKLFLLTTHLCCVEVRMVLEAEDKTQAFSNGRLLSSCYSYLECIINHLTAGPTLSLDERQILQLHAAMMGAFGAVVHFLKRVSEDSNIQWNSIVLATIRILAAWMAEETTALKDEVCELIPFLVQVSKLSLPIQNEVEQDNSCDTGDVTKCDDGVIDKTESCETDAHQTSEKQTESSDTGANRTINKETESHDISDDTTDKKQTEVEGEVKLKQKEDNNNDKNDEISKRLEEVKLDKSTDESDSTSEHNVNGSNKTKKNVTFEATNGLSEDTPNSENQLEKDIDDKTDKSEKTSSQRDYEQVYDVKILQNMASDDKKTLSEKELVDLHLRVNIFHFLLPGLCHMTADEIPRQILLNCGALSLLDLYMWRQWEKFLKMPSNREVQSSIVILCNIFLNLTIVEPDAITKYEEFSHILLLTVKGIQVVELNYVVMWSHLVTLGLMLVRLLHNKTDHFLETESISLFFQSCIKYVNGAYTLKYKKKGQAVLDLSEPFIPVWDQISQTWFLSMQAFSACIPMFKEAPSAVLQTGWLPTILKNLIEVRGNGVTEEIRSCYFLVLITMAKESEAARHVIKEKKGIEISKMYKAKDLQDILQNMKTSQVVKELTQT